MATVRRCKRVVLGRRLDVPKLRWRNSSSLFFEYLIKGGGEGNGGDGMERMEGGVGLIEAMFNVKHTIY